MSLVHYKFKSGLDYQHVKFDGLHISVADMKKEIVAQRQLRLGDFELEIANAQTGSVYKSNSTLIPRNASLIVSRVPSQPCAAGSTQKSWEAYKLERAQARELEKRQQQQQLSLHQMKKVNGYGRKKDVVAVISDIASSSASEIDKVAAIVAQSNKAFEPSKHRYGSVPDGYVCRFCKQTGHHASVCPSKPEVVAPHIKKPTGIPNSFLTIVDDPLAPGALLTDHGEFAVPTIDAQAYREGKKERPPFLPAEQQQVRVDKVPIPKELQCGLCHDLMTDAVVIPCCGNGYCDECIRNALLESEEHQCPACGKNDVSPNSIIQNNALRSAVLAFSNNSGYSKARRLSTDDARAPQQTISSIVASQISAFATKPYASVRPAPLLPNPDSTLLLSQCQAQVAGRFLPQRPADHPVPSMMDHGSSSMMSADRQTSLTSYYQPPAGNVPVTVHLHRPGFLGEYFRCDVPGVAAHLPPLSHSMCAASISGVDSLMFAAASLRPSLDSQLHSAHGHLHSVPSAPTGAMQQYYAAEGAMAPGHETLPGMYKSSTHRPIVDSSLGYSLNQPTPLAFDEACLIQSFALKIRSLASDRGRRLRGSDGRGYRAPFPDACSMFYQQPQPNGPMPVTVPRQFQPHQVPIQTDTSMALMTEQPSGCDPFPQVYTPPSAPAVHYPAMKRDVFDDFAKDFIERKMVRHRVSLSRSHSRGKSLSYSPRRNRSRSRSPFSKGRSRSHSLHRGRHHRSYSRGLSPSHRHSSDQKRLSHSRSRSPVIHSPDRRMRSSRFSRSLSPSNKSPRKRCWSPSVPLSSSNRSKSPGKIHSPRRSWSPKKSHVTSRRSYSRSKSRSPIHASRSPRNLRSSSRRSRSSLRSRSPENLHTRRRGRIRTSVARSWSSGKGRSMKRSQSPRRSRSSGGRYRSAERMHGRSYSRERSWSKPFKRSPHSRNRSPHSRLHRNRSPSGRRFRSYSNSPRFEHSQSRSWSSSRRSASISPHRITTPLKPIPVLHHRPDSTTFGGSSRSPMFQRNARSPSAFIRNISPSPGFRNFRGGRGMRGRGFRGGRMPFQPQHNLDVGQRPFLHDHSLGDERLPVEDLLRQQYDIYYREYFAKFGPNAPPPPPLASVNLWNPQQTFNNNKSNAANPNYPLLQSHLSQAAINTFPNHEMSIALHQHRHPLISACDRSGKDTQLPTVQLPDFLLGQGQQHGSWEHNRKYYRDQDGSYQLKDLMRGYDRNITHQDARSSSSRVGLRPASGRGGRTDCEKHREYPRQRSDAYSQEYGKSHSRDVSREQKVENRNKELVHGKVAAVCGDHDNHKQLPGSHLHTGGHGDAADSVRRIGAVKTGEVSRKKKLDKEKINVDLDKTKTSKQTVAATKVMTSKKTKIIPKARPDDTEKAKNATKVEMKKKAATVANDQGNQADPEARVSSNLIQVKINADSEQESLKTTGNHPETVSVVPKSAVGKTKAVKEKNSHVRKAGRTSSTEGMTSECVKHDKAKDKQTVQKPLSKELRVSSPKDEQAGEHDNVVEVSADINSCSVDCDVKTKIDVKEGSKDELMLHPPELSKWEREDYDLDSASDKQSKNQETVTPVEKSSSATMLPRSVLNRAETYMAQKPVKPAERALSTAASSAPKPQRHCLVTEKDVPLCDDEDRKTKVSHSTTSNVKHSKSDKSSSVHHPSKSSTRSEDTRVVVNTRESENRKREHSHDRSHSYRSHRDRYSPRRDRERQRYHRDYHRPDEHRHSSRDTHDYRFERRHDDKMRGRERSDKCFDADKDSQRGDYRSSEKSQSTLALKDLRQKIQQSSHSKDTGKRIDNSSEQKACVLDEERVELDYEGEESSESGSEGATATASTEMNSEEEDGSALKRSVADADNSGSVKKPKRDKKQKRNKRKKRKHKKEKKHRKDKDTKEENV